MWFHFTAKQSKWCFASAGSGLAPVPLHAGARPHAASGCNSAGFSRADLVLACLTCPVAACNRRETIGRRCKGKLLSVFLSMLYRLGFMSLYPKDHADYSFFLEGILCLEMVAPTEGSSDGQMFRRKKKPSLVWP